jgi:hypothetical protein
MAVSTTLKDSRYFKEMGKKCVIARNKRLSPEQRKDCEQGVESSLEGQKQEGRQSGATLSADSAAPCLGLGAMNQRGAAPMVFLCSAPLAFRVVLQGYSR